MSAVLSSLRSETGKRWLPHLAALALTVLLLVLLYLETLGGMIAIWDRSATFAHAFLVAPISLWLVWRKLDELRPLTPRPAPWVLLPLALAALAWLLGDLAGVNAATQFAFTALLVLTVPALLGLQVSRVILFPLAFLFFMVPFGDFLLPTLMDWTADFTVTAIQLSGIPVYREGLQFIIPSGTWSVIEACSGVRYLIASFMVGSLYAYLNYATPWRRVVFGLVSLAVPLLANWVRAYMIVMLGHLSGNKLAVGVDHLIYGWVFFGVVIMLMFFIGSRWSEPEAPPAPGPQAGLSVAQPAGAGLQMAVLVGSLLVLVLPQWAAHELGPSRGPVATLTLKLPDLAGTQVEESAVKYQPTFVNATALADRTYRLADGQSVSVHVAYYRDQTYGRKLVSSNNVLVASEDNRWQRVASGTTVTAASGNPLTWRTAALLGGHMSASSQRQRLDLRQIYWVNGRFTASERWAAVYGLWGRLSGQGDDGAMITVFTSGDSAQETSARLDAFVQQHLPAFQQLLERQRNAP